MKFTLSWLKSHLATDANAQELADALTRLGIEVEGLEIESEKFQSIVIAKIEEAKPHPKSSKLQLCYVNLGGGERLQIVCGAPNARSGLTSVLAMVGATSPGKAGMVIGKAKLAGEDSNGMLCSAAELGLGHDEDGILELPSDAPLGQNYAAYLGRDEAIFDIKVTPNRGDALGVRGIARDLAAAHYGTLKPMPWPSLDHQAGTFAPPIIWQIDHPLGDDKNSGACRYVAGRYFRGVKNGPSPQWLQDRLAQVGLRSISTLVDITNLLTHDLCRPLHVFDAKRLVGKSLVMRQAKAGETILALDGTNYQLDETITIISDDQGAVSIAGIMGGMDSGCQDDTTDVFLEVSLFDPISVARAGRKLSILSDARYRFERGLDHQSAEWGLAVATALILELCGGEASYVTKAGTIPAVREAIKFPLQRLASFGGIVLSKERVMSILQDLGFAVADQQESLLVTPPSWRDDVESVQCLIEEVLRVHGYDEVPACSLPRDTAFPPQVMNLTQRRRSLGVRALAQRGMREIVTWSFMDSRQIAPFLAEQQPVKLANPISSELDALRPSLMPNLLTAVARNAARGFADCAFFESGPVFHGRKPAEQTMQIGGLRSGVRDGGRHWQWHANPHDLYDAKADAVALLQAMGAPWQNLTTSRNVPAWYHPGRAGALHLGPLVLGYFGEIHPKILKQFDVKQKTIGFEIFVERIPNPKANDNQPVALKLSPFQPVSRDFAFLVERDIVAEKLLQAVGRAEPLLISDVRLFDIYEGAELGTQKSLALQVVIQAYDKTLTDAELQQVSDKIIAAAHKACAAQLRQA